MLVETQVLRVIKEQEDLLGLLVIKEQQEHKEPQEHKGLPGHKGQQAHKEHKEKLELENRKV